MSPEEYKNLKVGDYIADIWQDYPYNGSNSQMATGQICDGLYHVNNGKEYIPIIGKHIKWTDVDYDISWVTFEKYLEPECSNELKKFIKLDYTPT